jgi:hypothetical protein
MSNRPQPLEIDCDAPPYSIVRACHRIGIRSPEDVRWCRLRHAPGRRPGRPRELFNLQAWKAFLGIDEAERPACSCGQALPKMEMYTFTLLSGRQRHYFLGQCARCLCVYWEEP